MSDISAIVQSATESAGGAGEGYTPSDVTTETPTESSEPAAAAAEPEAPAAAEPDAKAADTGEEDDLKAIEAELTAKTPTLKNGKLSVSRHQAVLTRTRRQHEKEMEAFKAKYAQFDAPEWQQRAQAIALAENDPDVFFEKVLLATPQYKAIVDRFVESRLAANKPAATPAAADDETEPGPDILNADGTVGYSAEGLKRLRAWDAAQLNKQAEEKLKALRSELDPLLTDHKSKQLLTEATARVRPIYENAKRRWAGFVDHESEIYAALQANPTWGLEQAYDAVVPAKLALQAAQKEAAIEARLIEKMNKKSTMSSVVTPGGLPAPSGAPDPGSQSTEDIVRAAIRAAS